MNGFVHNRHKDDHRTTQWTIHPMMLSVAFAWLLVTRTKSSEQIFVKFSWTV